MNKPEPTNGSLSVTKRPFLERVYKIDRRIRDGQCPTTQQLADGFEVSPRTIQRDLTYLRDRMGAPLEYDAERRGFYYTDPSYLLPAVALTEGELLALFVSERAMRQYEDTPYGAQVRTAFDKLCRFLPEQISIDGAQLQEIYSFQTTAASVHDLDTFTALAQATLAGYQLRVEYHTMSRDAVNQRVVDPYHLGNINGNWYLFAFCHMRNEVRVFSPARIRSAEVTTERFRRPADFSIGDYLKDAFSIIKGGAETGLQKVRLRFVTSVARYVRERVWHPSQTLSEGERGDLVLEMRLEALDEIKRWVLSWGAGVTVLDPPQLREWVAAETLAMMNAHAQLPGA